MCQHHHVVTLAPAGRPIPPGQIAGVADAKDLTEARDGKVLLHPIGEPESHPSARRSGPMELRPPSLPDEKAVARVPTLPKDLALPTEPSQLGSHICLRRRVRHLGEPVTPMADPTLQHLRPTPRSSATCHCVGLLVATSRTDLSSNSFV